MASEEMSFENVDRRRTDERCLPILKLIYFGSGELKIKNDFKYVTLEKKLSSNGNKEVLQILRISKVDKSTRHSLCKGKTKDPMKTNIV